MFIQKRLINDLIDPLPSKQKTLFRRCNNVFDVQTTLYQRQNDVVCLLGKSIVQ